MMRSKVFLILFFIGTGMVSAQPGFQLLLFEDFEDETLSGWIFEKEWGITNMDGNNVLLGTSHDFFTRASWDRIPDYSFQCNLMIAGGGGHLLFRVADEGRYFLSFEDNNLSLTKESPWGVFHTLASVEPAPDLTEWVNIRISAIEDSISVHINDELRITHIDPQYLEKGTFGIESFDDSNVYMDSVIVYGSLPDSIGYISGRVTDSEGNPVENCRVNAGNFDEITECRGNAISDGLTDANGTYTLKVPFGGYALFTSSDTERRITPSAYKNIYGWSEISWAEKIIVNSRDTVPNIDFEVHYGHRVCGYLVDSSGNAVPAGGNAFNTDTYTEFGCSFGFGSNEFDGLFEVILPEGTYQIGFHDGTTSKTVVDHLPVFKDTCLGEVLFSEVEREPPSFHPKPVLPGYKIDTVIPGCPANIVDVAYHDSKILISATWSGNFAVDTSGGYEWYSPSFGYGIESGYDGKLYEYDFPGGNIRVHTGQGESQLVAKIPNTFCESYITVAPDGYIWISYSGCGVEDSSPYLFRVHPDGSFERYMEDFIPCTAIHADIHGNLYIGSGNEIYQLDIPGRSLVHLVTLPYGIGFHGLATDEQGNIYVSCDGQQHDYIYKYTTDGDLIEHCVLPEGDINGIELLPNNDMVVVMRATGAVYYVYGSRINKYKTLIPGNGLSVPTSVVVGTSGEIYIGNDESGRIARVTPGEFHNYYGLITYNPPTGYFTVDRSGNVYFSEAAPGLGMKLTKLIANSNSTAVVTESIQYPSGLAFDRDGNMIISEYMTGNILSLSANGDINTLYEGFIRPQALAMDSKGSIFVSSYNGVLQNPEDPGEHPGLGLIWKVDSSGNRQILSPVDPQAMLVSSRDSLYATIGDGRIVQILPDGRTLNFATGFLNPFGLAFSVTGDMYVTDASDNSVVRISGFPRGDLEGEITDASDQRRLKDVTIQVLTGYPNIKGTRLLSGENGTFSTGLAPDRYTAIISHAKYQTRVMPFQISGDDTIRLDIGLLLKPDTVPPQLVCRDTSISMTEDCLVHIDKSHVLESIRDESRIDTIYLDNYTFTCEDIGEEPAVTVTAIDEYGNMGQCVASVKITGLSGADEWNRVSGDPERFNIFPVPAEGILYIEGGEGSLYEITLYNIQGIPVLSETAGGKKAFLDVGHLHGGLYLVCIRYGENTVVRQKIIITGD